MQQQSPLSREPSDVNVRQEAQLSPSDRAMRRVTRNLASYHAAVQKLAYLYDNS